ncbi:deoxyuridine 5'-triphosphate nucleotidohydrolase [Haloferacaceae archaeon DSL9]
MFRAGSFVAAQLDGVADEQVQPNGVDLTVDAIFEQREAGRIGRDGKRIGGRRELETTDGAYPLSPGAYIVQYAETVRIPDGHIGFIYPRSTLMRNSCMLNTAVWDAGYEGRGEGLLQVHHDLELEGGARLAQLVLAEAAHDGRYEGSYQGERVE